MVGSNDLTKCKVSDTTLMCKKLLMDTLTHFPDCQVVLYGVPPRMSSYRWPGYENKRTEYNAKMVQFCNKTEGLHFASSTITIDQIKDNQIHIKSGAIKTVVTDESQTIQKNGKVVPKVMTQL